MNINPSAVAFDIDGVVADTMGLFLSIASEEFGITYARYEDIVEYDLNKCLNISGEIMTEIMIRILDGRYSPTLHPIPDAPRVLKRLNGCHQPTLFVTARPDAELIGAWLCNALGLDNGHIEVVATGTYDGKLEILQERDIRFFVEDRLETCFHLAEAGIAPIVFKQPWNRRTHPFREVETWGELESLIRFQ